MTDCIFCKIINKEAESAIVYEDERVIAFNDINPKAPVHILVVPKKHISDLNSATNDDESLLGSLMLRCAAIASDKGIAESGYKVIVNNGEDGGQIIQHLHLHLVGGQPIKVTV